MIVKMAGERAVKEAIAAYRSHMQHTAESLPVDEVILSTAHAKGTKCMSTYFLLFSAYELAITAFKKETSTDEKAKIEP